MLLQVSSMILLVFLATCTFIIFLIIVLIIFIIFYKCNETNEHFTLTELPVLINQNKDNLSNVTSVYTSTVSNVNVYSKDLGNLKKEIINKLEALNNEKDENGKFKEGITMERFNQNQLLKMMLEIIVDIVDNSKKQLAGDKNDDALYQQNKKHQCN